MPKYLDTRGNSVLSVAICDRCRRKFAYTELMPDPNFPGMRVCKDDLDNFDPWRLPARQTENIALRFPRPDTDIAVRNSHLLTETGFTNNNTLFIDGVPPTNNGQGDISLYGAGINPGTPKNPKITSVSPTSGSAVGGTLITITGTNFTDVTNVLIGGRFPPTYTVIDTTTITAITPAPLTVGLADVEVITANYGSAVAYGAFTYE